MKNKTFLLGLFGLTILLMASGCADVQEVHQCTTGYTYGFWSGLWHGSIAPLSFIGELFSDDISIYAVNNSGGWYDFGYVLGLGGFINLIEFIWAVLFK